MLIKSKDSSKTIICIDAYNQDILNLQYTKKQNNFFISYLKYKDLTVGQIELANDIKDNEIAQNLSLRAYKDFNLQSANDHKIVYQEISGNSSNRIFNIIIATNSAINKIFSQVVKKTNYIDYVVAAPLMFKSLYENLILPKNTDVFLFFQNDDAFITAYKDGEHLQSRPVRYNFKNIYEKFLKTTNSQTSYEKFLKILNESKDGNLEQIYDEISYYMSDVINSITRVSNISLDNIFIMSDLNLNGLALHLQSKLEIKTKYINFKNFNYTNVINFLLTNVALTCQKNIYNDFNFSIFKRPATFFKRQSGKLALSIILAFIISIFAPAYHIFYIFLMQNENTNLQNKLNQINNDSQKMQVNFKNMQYELSGIKNELEKEQNQSELRKKLLVDIEEKKSNYAMKAVVLSDLAGKILEQKIRLTSLKNIDKNITLSLISSSDKSLTSFIQDIGNDEKYIINAKDITKYGDNYESNVTVQIR